MDQYFMDQIIDSMLDDDYAFSCFDSPLSHLFKETPQQRRRRERKEREFERNNTCERCGGQKRWGSCDCYWSPGPYGHGGEWTRGG